MTKKHFLLVLLSLTFFTVFGQDNKIFDQVKKLNANKEYKASIKVLEQYLKTNKDVYTLWLYGETLHADEQFNKALIAYRKALNLDPDNSVLQYDYAVKLADAGRLNSAIKALKPFADYKNAYQFLALKQLAKVYYWQGAYDKAQKTLRKAQKIKNDNEIDWLRGDINKAQRNKVSAGFSVFTDDQPLEVYNPQAGIAIYLNEHIHLGAEMAAPKYRLGNTDYSALSLKPYLSIHFLQAMLTTTIKMGYEKLPNEENVISGKLSLSKSISKNWSAQAGFSYKPYLHTLMAIENKLMESHYNGALDYNKTKGFMGRISIDQYNFSTLDNGYYAAGAWLLSPKIFLGNVATRIGIGASYSDAAENTFTANDDLATIIANYPIDTKIAGHYQNFFSPSEQFITSVILSTDIPLSKGIVVGADVNIGVYAKTQNPYLFLNRNSENQIIIDTGFVQMNYTPVTANAFLNIKLTQALGIKTYYTYQSTNYYVSNLAGITAVYTF